MPAAIMPGAEPFSAAGGPAGALLLHGFCGSPFGMRRTALRLAARGLTVEVPLLPGHGTAIEDLLPLGWSDWSSAVEEAYTELSARCARVAVVGHSMGGALACWLAERHPGIRGIAVVNPLVQPFGEEVRSGARTLLEEGTVVWTGGPPDTADPTASFPVYAGTPLAAFLSLDEGVEEVALGLGRITCPVLCISSRQDHVVPPANGDLLVSSVSGPSARVWIERSYHNAMVDFDHDEIERRAEEFIVSVTAEPREEDT
jgi:carboxylesterase